MVMHATPLKRRVTLAEYLAFEEASAEKFVGYRSIETLRDYVMLASGDAHAEHYTRGSDGGWTLREYRVGGVFSLSSVEVVLRVDELYEGAFDATDAG